MYAIHALQKDNDKSNEWPPTARQIRRQGRTGKKPRPVIAVRIKAPSTPSR